MEIDEIIDHVTSLGGVLVLRPQPGDGAPEIAWGDVFFFYAPDGRVPHGQPFATIVTKPYPDEEPDQVLAQPESFRLNVDVGRQPAAALLGASDAAAGPDVWARHPVYGALGWVVVVNPGERTAGRARELLRAAHAAARARRERRDGLAPGRG